MKRFVFLVVAVLALTGCSGAGSEAPLSDKAIMTSLQATGFPVKGVVAYTAETDPNKLLGRPNQYIAKVNWGDTRTRTGGASVDDGTIEVYPELEGAKKRAEYVETLGKSLPAIAQYVYVNEKRRAVLRVSHDLTPDQAKAYQDWFSKL